MSDLTSFVSDKYQRRLAAYRSEQGDIKEHAGIEETVLAGGYGYRQVLELVQNGADAILEAGEESEGSQQDARIEVVLGDRHLYVANTGAPLSQEGVEALLQSHSSPKRGNQIGRFGLGFKSLLRLGGQVDVFSRSGSLRFDPERCKAEIRKEFALPEDVPVPGLRLAWAVNRMGEEAADPLLARFSWATTIVRAEICNTSIKPHLTEEIRNFPAPFLLFLPIKVSLDLDVGDGTKLKLHREPEGSDVILHDSESPSRWRVVEHEVRITDESARNDATHLHARESVPLAWAIPLEGPKESGRFWAFFPTDTQTRLPGILNAPWKLNNDRKALIPGDWNTALMREAAKLVADYLPKLSTPEDPGRLLDAFPRQLEHKDEPAAPLVNAIWQAIKTAPIIADAQGTLRMAAELRRPPLDDPALHAEWCGLAGDEALCRWVHPSCFRGDRHARLKELAEQLRKTGEQGFSQTKASDWFAEIASNDLELAKHVLDLVSHYAGKLEQWQWQKERPALAIIPTENNQLSAPDRLVIAPSDVSIPGRESVAQALVDAPASLRILTEVLGVKRLDGDGWQAILQSALKHANSNQNDQGWRHFWETLRLAPNDIRTGFVSSHQVDIRVSRCDGNWVLHDEALYPSRLVSSDDPDLRNRGVLVNEITHGDDQALLTDLGVSDLPTGQRPVNAKSLRTVEGMWQWRSAASQYYSQSHKGYDDAYLDPLSSFPMPNGWCLLTALKGLPSSRLTTHLLEAIAALPEYIEFGHTGGSESRKKYPPEQVSHPMRWLIRFHGSAAIGRRAVPLNTLLARRDIPALAEIQGWAAVAPHLGILDNLIGAPSPPKPTEQQLKTLWQALFEHLATLEATSNDSLGGLWLAAAKDRQVPDSLPGANGPVPLSEIWVTGSGSLTQRARHQGKTAITLETEALRLWLDRGARHLDAQFRAEWAETLDAPMPLATLEPDLIEVLRDEAKALARPVRDLKLVIEGESQAASCLLWEDVLYLDPMQLERLSRVERLDALLREAGAAGWLNQSVDKARDQVANAQLQTNRDYVAAGETLPDRLLRAVGSKVATLIGLLGDHIQPFLPPTCEPRKVAELTLARFGPAVLQQIKHSLADEGLRPPNRWGGDEARAFVTALGFPESFAASEETKRDAEEYISGPIPLGPLHDYQEEVIKGLRTLIQQGTGRRRAIVSLPTGGGKTRVTVQAAVDLVLKPSSGKRSVLWIAQTDELCEQAVQAFRQVWLNRGVERTDLRIARLWGSNPNPSAPPAGQPTVVVASIQTLNSPMRRVELGWLNQPGLVVVDECQHAIAPSYTGLLKWLNAGAPRPGTTPTEEPPIIGLSATPFRGSDNDEENRLLLNRFDNHWLPGDQRALHEKLTMGGMLSRAEHEALKSPVVTWPNEVLTRMQQQAELSGTEFENLLKELNDWLADDEDRNQLLLQTISNSPEQSILFFTNSVRHAEEMADRLNLQGISAHAISGNTPTSARRYFLERFQRGEARVLCNHSVLTTGFDAPKTDMVLIARQVSSPVLYMQMVGRGLRGPANGGTERCRIVTVEENLGKFRDRLPYDYFAKYAGV